jgi:hypothetical protein
VYTPARSAIPANAIAITAFALALAMIHTNTAVTINGRVITADIASIVASIESTRNITGIAANTAISANRTTNDSHPRQSKRCRQTPEQRRQNLRNHCGHRGQFREHGRHPPVMAITFHIGIVGAFAPASSANTVININIRPSAMPAKCLVAALGFFRV